MTDTTVEVDPGEKKLLTVTIRGKCGTLDVDTSKIVDDETYEKIFLIGLETAINKVGMSKIAAGLTKLSGAALEAAKAAVLKQAQENVEAIYAGNLKGLKKTAKATGAVQTEAMRLAKAQVKELLRANGYKIGAFSAKELTDYAKEVLAANPELLKKAEANLEERKATPVKGIDLKKMLGSMADNPEAKAKPKVPPKPKAKGEKPTLSAKQAGLVAPRAKPGVGAVTH